MATSGLGEGCTSSAGGYPRSKRVMALLVVGDGGDGAGDNGSGGDGSPVNQPQDGPPEAPDARAIAAQLLREWAIAAASTEEPAAAATVNPLMAGVEAMIARSSMGSEATAWQLRLDVIDILIGSVNGMTALIRGIMPAIPAQPIQIAPPQINEEEEEEEEEVVQEEPPAEPFMMFPNNRASLIGDAIQQGRKFLAFFINDFMVRIQCPPEFSETFGDTMTPSVRIIGEAGHEIEVPTHIVDGSIILSGPWFNVVETEKIIFGDIGLFIHYAPNHLALFLFTPNGNEKPMASRPEIWSPQTAYENHVALYRNPIAQSILLAHPMMHMWFDHSNSTDFTWQILSTMLQLWINNPISYPLYAIRLNESNVHKYKFYLNSRVSRWFVDEKPVRFYNEDEDVDVHGILKKKRNLMQACHGAWREMVQLYGYRVGEVVVLAMRDEPDGAVSIRVYPVDE